MNPEGTTGRLSLFRSLGEFCGSATTAQRPKKATELSSRCRRYLTTQAAEAKSACRAGKSTSSAVRTLKNGPYRSSIGRGTQPRVTITAHVRFFLLTICLFSRPPPVPLGKTTLRFRPKAGRLSDAELLGSCTLTYCVSILEPRHSLGAG